MNLPESFLDSIQNVKGFSREAFVQEHLFPERITSLRTNPYKWKQADTANSTNSLQLLSPVPWCETGYYLPARPLFILDPLFHAGCYYVQEASSMFLEQYIRELFPDRLSEKFTVLDLCAAPGGKSTHLAALFPEGLIVSNEVIKSRVGILTENVVKWGKENAVVTCNDAADFSKVPGFFDLMVVDAPCSGSGMFRKNPDAVEEWSLQNVVHCSKRQQRIIADSWPALKENGVLIYSTCSYSKEENEDMLDWIADNYNVESIPLSCSGEWGVIETISDRKAFFGYRFYPDKVKGEGFFIACIKKKDVVKTFSVGAGKLAVATKQEKIAVNPFLTNPEEFAFTNLKDELRGVRRSDWEDIEFLSSALNVRNAGVAVGRVIRDEIVPSHDLALSTIINSDLNSMELDQETALDYLRKKDISVGNVSKGWNVVRFMGHNLGWVKVLSNRVNNHYPSSSRILKH